MKQTIDAAGLKAAENRILQERLTGNINPGSEALKRAASEGRLLYEEIPGGLALFERRSNVIVLRFALGKELITYILTDGLELPVVCETAYRSGDRQLRSTTAFLKHQGFELGARRMRLSIRPEQLKAGSASSAAGAEDSTVISKAVPEDLTDLMDLIKLSFDPLTGCIPEEKELLEDIENGLVITAKEGGRLVGLHQLRIGGSVSETRHIAVAPDVQRHGTGEAMMLVAFEREGIKTHRLWVNTDNKNALYFYEKLGFGPDGRSSDVMVKR
ncbi:MAG: GNAT family N-acetyltransferase [Firmicutes bacterium]|nr:GNAT family N-acetyltransferase [Bacillota bacterium]